MSVEKWADMAMLLEAKLDKANALNNRLVEALESVRALLYVERHDRPWNEPELSDPLADAKTVIDAALSAAKEPQP